MKRLADWPYRHWLVVLIGPLCFVLGIVVTFPYGFVLPNEIAALFGSMAGAAITVAGAVAVWIGQERWRAEQTVRSIVNSCGLLLADLEEISLTAPDIKNLDLVRANVEAAQIRLAKARIRIARHHSAIPSLSPLQNDVFHELEDELDGIQQALEAANTSLHGGVIINAVVKQQTDMAAYRHGRLIEILQALARDRYPVPKGAAQEGK